MQETSKDSRSDVRVDHSAVAVDDDQCIALEKAERTTFLRSMGHTCFGRGIPFLSIGMPYPLPPWLPGAPMFVLPVPIPYAPA